ncbi:DegQ family serine endoprotease [Halothiobacillus sp. DCM-1]|uniref:DegQ family serine endoprotease n=1 Tax=Halothiobacillus sp. DCM-1 TaxID=3112558 RepID=UPI0032479F29
MRTSILAHSVRAAVKAPSRLLAAALLAAPLVMLAPAPSFADTVMPDYVQLVKQSSPWVVNISTISKPKQSAQFDSGNAPIFPPGPAGDMFRHFFQQMPQQANREPIRSLGSGFIISADGYILTNAHVVADADKITVRLPDQQEYAAKVIGKDKRTDIALLKIDAKNLPVAPIGNSDQVQVGEWVLAIGEPFGLDHSATHGIVSAIGRDLPDESYVPFIQTDAPVNPGNSGGPLIDANGKVIGINSQIYTKSGGYMGISFAIPINVAMNVVDQLKTTGHVTRGYLGVLIQPVTDELAKSFGLDNTRGALVSQVQPNTPAAKAGLKSGDIITKFNGKEVKRSGELPIMVGMAPIGKPATLTVLRDGKEHEMTVTIEKLDKQAIEASEGSRAAIEKMGLKVSPLSPDDLQQLGIKYGVKVDGVKSDSPFASVLTAGDILLEVNRQSMQTVDDLKKALDSAPKDRPIAIRLLRDGQPLFLAIQLND